MYKSILVPIDLAHPETAKPMFDEAKALLAESGILTVVHVVPDIPNYVTAEMPDGFVAETTNKASTTLKQLIADVGVTTNVEILKGQAPRAILEAAEKAGSDLILVSSHRPGLSDYFLGSTAARVVRHAKCSVLVMR